MNGPNVVVEAWMAQKLGLPMSWDGGVTTREERRERIRRAIVDTGRESAIAGKRAGQPCETWQALFERVYRQPLTTTETTT